MFCKLLALDFSASVSQVVGGASSPGENFDAGAIFASRIRLIEHEFQVTNTTGQAIEILGETHSCTCTEVAVRKGKLEPGETIVLKLKVKPYLNRADGSISCTLKTNHPQWKEWTYFLHYRCFPDAQIVADRVDLGTIWVDRPSPSASASSSRAPDAWLEVYDTDTKGQVKHAQIESPPGVTARVGVSSESVLDSGVRKVRYPIFLDLDRSNTRLGTFAQPLNVRVSSKIIGTTTLVWTVAGPLTIDPPQAFVGVIVGPNPPNPVRLAVRSVRGTPFRILAVKGNSELIIATTEKAGEAAKEHTIAIGTSQSKPTTKAAAISRDVTIETDLPGAETFRLPWSAFIQR